MIDPTVLNVNVINAIKEKLPENVNISHFLTDLLFLNKGAVYRRLRGEIPFSFHEIFLIAKELDVSLDYLAKSTGKEAYNFELVLQQFHSEKENFTKNSNKFEQILGNILTDPTSVFELSYNLFPQVPTHLFYHLSKYNCFKWVYSNNTHQPVSFKKVDYPKKIYEMHKINNMATMNIKQTSYIWDHTIIEMLVREINYFEDIKLIDKEDVTIIKEELHEFLDYVEELTIKGVFPTGNKINIYITSVSSDAAYSYMESERSRICIIGVLDLQYVISTNSLIFDIIKGKIMSLKKGATLITESNEMFRISFFHKQRELVNSL